MTEGDLRVWWVPQVPCRPFYVAVASIDEAKLIYRTLGQYDLFQFSNRIKPDYCNAGRLQVFDAGEWVEWSDEETGDDLGDIMWADEP